MAFSQILSIKHVSIVSMRRALNLPKIQYGITGQNSNSMLFLLAELRNRTAPNLSPETIPYNRLRFS